MLDRTKVLLVAIVAIAAMALVAMVIGFWPVENASPSQDAERYNADAVLDDSPLEQSGDTLKAPSVPQSANPPVPTIEPFLDGALPNVDVDFQLTGTPEIGSSLNAVLDFSVPDFSAIVTSQGGPTVDVTVLLVVADHYTIQSTVPACNVCGENSAGVLGYEWDLSVTAGITDTISVSLSPQAASGHEEEVKFRVRDRYSSQIGNGSVYHVKVGDGVSPGSITLYY